MLINLREAAELADGSIAPLQQLAAAAAKAGEEDDSGELVRDGQAAAAAAAGFGSTGELVRDGRQKGQAAAAAAGDTNWGAKPANHGERVRDGHRRGKAAGQKRARETKKRASCIDPGCYNNRQACGECEVCTAAPQSQKRRRIRS